MYTQGYIYKYKVYVYVCIALTRSLKLTVGHKLRVCQLETDLFTM